MPKITPPSPVLTTTLLRGTPLVLNARRPAPAPVDHVVVTPPPGPVQSRPVQNGPIQNPSTPPVGLSGERLAQWVLERLAEQERLRAGSFWDTGYFLSLLMPHKELLGSADLKALIERLDLGMSHMTAQKYMMVARAFDRQTAQNTGIEKCYALTLYAKAIGRADEAGRILSANERIQGSDPGQRAPFAQTVSASQLRACTKRIKGSKEPAVPTAVQAERVKLGNDAAKLLRSLGLKKASAKVVRHDGQPKIAIYIPIESARTLDSMIVPSMTALLGKLARKRPEVVTLLRAKVPGLTLKRAS